MERKRIKVKGIIFDIDGVLEFKGKAYGGAVETVNSLKKRGIILRFLTNSTLKSRKSCAEKLREKGFLVEEEEVITASSATAAYLETLNPASCLVLLEREGLEEFRNFRHDTENPEYIVVGDYRNNFNFENLNKALRLLAGGAHLIGMQSELVDTSGGELELNVGSWVQMLEKASGKKATSIGKPNPYVFNLALESMNLRKEDVLMVGDRIDSDIKGAQNAMIQSVLIKTGEFSEKDYGGDITPDYVLDSIEELAALID